MADNLQQPNALGQQDDNPPKRQFQWIYLNAVFAIAFLVASSLSAFLRDWQNFFWQVSFFLWEFASILSDKKTLSILHHGASVLKFSKVLRGLSTLCLLAAIVKLIVH